MPTVEREGVRLHYATAGSGETVVFVGDAGFGAWQWGWQYRALAGPHRTVVYDHRGTGRSDTPSGPYTVSTLAADLEAVLQAVGSRRTHLVGAGLGGMVALAYTRSYDRARRLALIGTAARGDVIDVNRARTVETATSDAFTEAHPDVLAGVQEWQETDDAATDGWQAQAAAVADFDGREWIHDVTVPTLVFHGTADRIWPMNRGETLAEDLPRGEFVPLDGAGHLAWVEHSRAVNDRLTAFLADR